MTSTDRQPFEDVVLRLDQIVAEVRNSKTSLEESLDLLDEAIALGARAVEIVDTSEPSPSEREAHSLAAGDGREAVVDGGAASVE